MSDFMASKSAHYLMMHDVSYRIAGKAILEEINVTGTENSCTALVGANGAGKTTFLKLCHGLLPPSSGYILWQGKSAAQMGRSVAMVFQQPHLLRRSVYANLAYVLALRGIQRRAWGQYIDGALQLVNLERFSDRDATSLSVGEQKKLAIARAWLLQPKIILMDEPGAGLDLVSSKGVEDLILRLKQQNIKIIFSSHNLAQVRRLCDEVIFLSQGRVVKQCRGKDFFDGSKEDEVCEFIRLQSLG